MSFAPVYDDRSRALILGTWPSPKSREMSFYYGHPQNRFWPMMAVLIRDVVPNDIAGLLRKAPIRAVFCNGATAYRIYTKYQQPLTGIPAVRLPSTSPANAACSPARLEALWGAALADWIVK